MATYATVIPTGLTDGVPLLVTSTATTGQEVHTAHATLHDEIDLWAANFHTADVDLTIEIGGATSPIVVTIPYKAGPIVLIEKMRLTNSKTVKVWAVTTGSVIRVGANVNRITP